MSNADKVKVCSTLDKYTVILLDELCKLNMTNRTTFLTQLIRAEAEKRGMDYTLGLDIELKKPIDLEIDLDIYE